MLTVNVPKNLTPYYLRPNFKTLTIRTSRLVQTAGIGHCLLDGGGDLEAGVVHRLVFTPYFEGDDYKKGRQLFFEKKCTPDRNPGYTYVFMYVTGCREWVSDV